MKRLYLFLILISMTALMACPVISQDQPVPGSIQAIGPDTDCFTCHDSSDLKKELPGGQSISLFINKKNWQKSKHTTMGCEACHGNQPHPPEDQVNSLAGWENFRTGLAEACAGCHADEQKAFNGSVHAASSNSAAPRTCTGCHNPHEAGLATATKRKGIKVCGKCHQHAEETYFLSVHGQNLSLGNEKVAVCYDCHGYHSVRSVKTFSNKYVAGICSKCHKGATARTVAGWYSHTPVTNVQRLIMDITRIFYIIIIPLTLASMIAHQVLKHRKTLERRRVREEETE